MNLKEIVVMLALFVLSINVLIVPVAEAALQPRGKWSVAKGRGTYVVLTGDSDPGGVAFFDFYFTTKENAQSDNFFIWRLDAGNDRTIDLVIELDMTAECIAQFLYWNGYGSDSVTGDWNDDGQDEFWDWNGDGTDDFWDFNGDGKDEIISVSGDSGVIGDWDGDGQDEITIRTELPVCLIEGTFTLIKPAPSGPIVRTEGGAIFLADGVKDNDAFIFNIFNKPITLGSWSIVDNDDAGIKTDIADGAFRLDSVTQSFDLTNEVTEMPPSNSLDKLLKGNIAIRVGTDFEL
jgi:hypothetical protein